MRKFLLAFSAFLLSCSVAIAPLATHAAFAGLVKGEGPAVYWYGTDGFRYVFPNEGSYASWFEQTQPIIQQVSESELGAIPLKGIMTYRPGKRLIKVTTDPKVYAVSRYGVLRWIQTEALATQLYGADWAHQVDDMPDAFFVNYMVGSPIDEASDFDPAVQKFVSISPEDDLRTTTAEGSNVTILGLRFALTLSKTHVEHGETITLTAKLHVPQTSPAIQNIEIYDPRTGRGIQLCKQATTCTVAFPYEIRYGTVATLFSARGYDASGAIVAEERFPLVRTTTDPFSFPFEITDVVWKDVPVSGGLPAAKVALILNRQPKIVTITFTNTQTGEKKTGGYTLTERRQTATPYNDQYATQFEALSFGTEYAYEILVEDWQGKTATRTGAYRSLPE